MASFPSKPVGNLNRGRLKPGEHRLVEALKQLAPLHEKSNEVASEKAIVAAVKLVFNLVIPGNAYLRKLFKKRKLLKLNATDF